MSRVLLPGSYDPVTLGHLEIIKKAAKTYDEVFVVIFVNSEKTYTFSTEERKEMLRLATEELPNVFTDSFDGYVVDYARQNGIDLIVKGYRNDTDLEYEKIQAEYNLKNGGFNTELWLSDESFSHISSTLAREYIEKGENLEKVLPEKVISYINSH